MKSPLRWERFRELLGALRRRRMRLIPDRRSHSEFQGIDRKSTRLNSSHSQISYAVFCLKKKTNSDYSAQSRQHWAPTIAPSSDPTGANRGRTAPAAPTTIDSGA